MAGDGMRNCSAVPDKKNAAQHSQWEANHDYGNVTKHTCLCSFLLRSIGVLPSGFLARTYLSC